MIAASLCNPWLAPASDRHHHCFLCYRVLSDPLPLLLSSSLYRGHASTATATVDHTIATALLLHPLADVAFLLLNCNLLCSSCTILNSFPSLATVGPVLLPSLLPTSSFPRSLSSFPHWLPLSLPLLQPSSVVAISIIPGARSKVVAHPPSLSHPL
ncbi:hypothetical protein BHM03_00006453 [Ensete ventricosum]|uniref:Uncharacterized protein n=1 Tax=Ensete ventricosum TaxID=4639 RepID=A0A445MBP5_ENSVE|nr:hypothetical protein BHM03_00006453 [Ensete ventricosum]